MEPNVFFALPYYSGSHKYWADNIIKYGNHNYHLETMSGRHWKWRMQGSAIHLSEKYAANSEAFDLVLCSTMMDVSLFKSMTNCQVPLVYYMHENQLTYPFSESDKRLQENFHYGFINFKSCLAANLILFNSEFHRTDFFNSLEKLLDRLPDYIDSTGIIERFYAKSKINYVGLDFSYIDQVLSSGPLPHLPKKDPTKGPTLLWSHRWEHDKNPVLFQELLDYLENQNQDFQLILLGADGNASSIKEDITDRYKNQVLYSGFAETREDYYKLIKMADLLPVTSIHDFYGLSVLEAVYLGVTPLLPHNRVYEEFISSVTYPSIYYSEKSNKDLFFKLSELMANPSFNLSTTFLNNHHCTQTTAFLEDIFESILSS